jgi:hypothetical protein
LVSRGKPNRRRGEREGDEGEVCAGFFKEQLYAGYLFSKHTTPIDAHMYIYISEKPISVRNRVYETNPADIDIDEIIMKVSLLMKMSPPADIFFTFLIKNQSVKSII